ncbi:MAG: hypothetical protein HGA94_02505, partial [Candidatus Aminicenantes bacterium]|nr:hypothetical protein [Candidatus Aminicenantes bacterium]
VVLVAMAVWHDTENRGPPPIVVNLSCPDPVAGCSAQIGNRAVSVHGIPLTMVTRDVEHVRRLTNRPVERLALKDSNRTGEVREEGQALIINRPQIKRNETARPRQVLDEDKAERQLSTEQSGRVYRRVPRSESEALREDHDQERRLLKESQESEVEVIRRGAEEEKAKIQRPEEKQKVEGQVASKISEIKKKHEQEKAELEKRQKSEEEKAQTKRAPLKKKKDPDKS